MRESLDLMADGRITPASMVTHIGGLSCVPETTLRLPQIPGGKKLIYTHADLPLTAIAVLRVLANTILCLQRLPVRWNWAEGSGDEAERILLAHYGA